LNIIVNSTPLISLAVIHQLELLRKIFHTVYLPQSVYNEVIVNGHGKLGDSKLSAINWFQIVDPNNIALKHSIMLQLDEGEAEVITIANDKSISLVCIDAFAGRQYAGLLGLDVIGTLGILLIAKRKGYISLVKPLLDKLIFYKRHISHSLYYEILLKAGES